MQGGETVRKALSMVLAAASIGLACPAFGAGREVARVNGAPITAEAVTAMMVRLQAGKGRGAEAPGGKDVLRKEAMDRVIFEELAYQKARADGVVADPQEVNRGMEDLRAKMGGADGLNQALAKENRTEGGLLADIERDIVLRRIFVREVSGKVSLSEEDLAREYEREKGRFVRPEKVVVDDIVFFLMPDDSASVERAEAVRRKVLEDGDRNPWRLVPDGTFIVHEAEIHRETQKELYEEAVKLKPGEISGVIGTWDSLHVVRLKEYTPMEQLSLSQVRGVLERKLKADAMQARARQWDAELRKGAKIEIMDTGERKPQGE